MPEGRGKPGCADAYPTYLAGDSHADVIDVAAKEQVRDSLRETFVEMLFALAAAQIAVRVANLIEVTPWNTWDAVPPILHLLLTLFLIAVSYLGWKDSQAPGRLKPRSLFSMSFVGLLIDVVLVIAYFIAVERVELESVIDPKSGEEHYMISAPSAVPESIIVTCVFGLYLLYDLVSDVLPKHCRPQTGTWLEFLQRLPKLASVAFVSIFASLVSGGFATLILLAARTAEISPAANVQLEVALLDVALIALLFLFRVLKAAENPLGDLFRIREYKAFAERRPETGSEAAIATCLVPAIVMLVILRRWV